MMAQASFRENRKHYIEYFLPFFALLAPYRFGPVSADTIGLIVVAGLMIIRNQGRVKVLREFRPFLYFLAYVIFRDVIRMILGSDTIQTQMNRIIEYLINYALVFVVCSEDFDDDKLYKVWKIAGFIYSLGLLYHLVQIYIMGQMITPISIIPGYSIRATDTITSVRPCSFFSEPAAFVNAMLPLEFLALRKRDLKIAFFVTIIILASTSTVGIILSIVLWSTSFLERDLKTRYKFLLIIATIGMIYLFANLDIFGASLSKLLLAAEGGSTFGSRVTGSFEIVGAESWIERIIGTNYNEVGGFIATHNGMFSSRSIIQIYWKNGTGDVFLNTFGQLFFKYGLIGFILYMTPLIMFLRDKNYAAKQYVIMVIFAVFGQTMLLNSHYFMTIMLLMLFSKTDAQLSGTEIPMAA